MALNLLTAVFNQSVAHTCMSTALRVGIPGSYLQRNKINTSFSPREREGAITQDNTGICTFGSLMRKLSIFELAQKNLHCPLMCN